MDAFSIIKAIHLVAIFSWIPALLILGRLLIFHSDALESGLDVQSDLSKRFTMRQTRILNIFATPTAAISILTGLAMILVRPEIMEKLWLHLLVFLVVPVFYFHISSYQYVEELSDPTMENRGTKFFRIVSEAMVWPCVLTVVLMMVLRDLF